MQRLDLCNGRPAAMVAHTEKAHGIRQINRLGFHRPTDMVGQVSGAGAIAACDTEGRHAAAIWRLPPERLGHTRHLMRAGAHEDVCIAAALAENLRQRLGVTEAIHAVGHGRLHPQTLPHVGLGEQNCRTNDSPCGKFISGWTIMPLTTCQRPSWMRCTISAKSAGSSRSIHS